MKNHRSEGKEDGGKRTREKSDKVVAIVSAKPLAARECDDNSRKPRQPDRDLGDGQQFVYGFHTAPWPPNGSAISGAE